MTEISRIDALNIEVEAPEQYREQLVDLIDDALHVAAAFDPEKTLTREVPPERMVAVSLAASAAAQTVNALLSAALVKCDRTRPTADIQTILDSSGRLIYRCNHYLAHKWGLDGQPIVQQNP